MCNSQFDVGTQKLIWSLATARLAGWLLPAIPRGTDDRPPVLADSVSYVQCTVLDNDAMTEKDEGQYAARVT